MFYKMFLTVTIAVFLIGCGAAKTLQVEMAEDLNEFKEINDPTSEFLELASELTENGGIAVVGMGQSKRMDYAKEKSKLDGETKIAQEMNTKITNLRKKAGEEIGSGESVDEINDAYSNAAKLFSTAVLKGAIVKKEKLARRKDGQYLSIALIVINPKMLNTALFDEVKKNKPKLYERIRTSQLYDDLNAEEKKYDEKAKELGVE